MGLWDWISGKATSFVNTFMGPATPDKPAGDEQRSPLGNPVHVFVRERRGSMFVDSDGDVAHEFYTQRPDGSFSRVTRGISPQGTVAVSPPRISCNVPIVLQDARVPSSASSS